MNNTPNLPALCRRLSSIVAQPYTDAEKERLQQLLDSGQWNDYIDELETLTGKYGVVLNGWATRTIRQARTATQ